MLALKGRNLAKVVQPQDGRFPAVPGKPDHRLWGGFDVLDDVLLKDIIGHPKRLSLRVEMFFLQIVAVVTVQVADGANRLDKDLKVARSFGHICIFYPKKIYHILNGKFKHLQVQFIYLKI